MKKKKVYIETSVISYLTSNPSSDLIIAGHQKITYDWWHSTKNNFDCYISEFVKNEIIKGDNIASSKRLEVINDINILEFFPEIEELANEYFKLLKIPEKARFDTFHLAMACIHNINFLVSWNCKHIANVRINEIIRDYNNKLRINTPFLCTPEELI